MTRRRKGYAVVLTAVLALFALSVSIAVPLVCRSFYYMQIEPLNLPEKTGYTAAEIRDAFDEMMDFCVKGEPFGTGVLPWSESGKSHFADCAKLFRLDFAVLGVSAAGMAVCLALYLRGTRPALWKGRGPMFWAGALPAAAFAVLAGLAAADFDRAFTVFHHLFFPGKDNWIFNAETDAIIRILPEEFFRNCAILIAAVLLLLCILLMFADGRVRKREALQTENKSSGYF